MIEHPKIDSVNDKYHRNNDENKDDDDDDSKIATAVDSQNFYGSQLLLYIIHIKTNLSIIVRSSLSCRICFSSKNFDFSISIIR